MHYTWHFSLLDDLSYQGIVQGESHPLGCAAHAQPKVSTACFSSPTGVHSGVAPRVCTQAPQKMGGQSRCEGWQLVVKWGVPAVDCWIRWPIEVEYNENVGPMDLSYNLGVPGDFDSTGFRDAVQTIVSACRDSGKAAGILVAPDRLQRAKDEGFTLIAVGSDGGCLNLGFDILRRAIDQLR